MNKKQSKVTLSKQTSTSLKNHKVKLDINDNLFVITSLDGKFRCSYDIFNQVAKFWHCSKQLSMVSENAREMFKFWVARKETNEKHINLVYSSIRDDIKTAVRELMDLVKNYKTNVELFKKTKGEPAY